MKHFIRNLEKEYLVIIILVVGCLLILFPEAFSIVFPWILGAALAVHGILIIILALYYKDSRHGPGKAIVYCVLGLTIMILGSRSTGIIGVIWAVFALMEVGEEIDRMWKEDHYSAVCLISSVISVVLAILLMADPFRHFVTHVRVLGLEILASCIARRASIIKSGRRQEHPKEY